MTQVKRSVRIAFPGGTAPQEVQSDATTWGDLKDQLKNDLGESFKNQKVRDYDTNHHYADANAVLPEGDIKLLVSTDKNKSGMAINKGNYGKAGFSELRTFAKKITGFAPNGKQACLDALDKHYGKTSAPAAKAAPKKAVKKAAAPKVEKKAEKKAEKKSAAKETSSPGAKSSAKAKSSDSALESRVSALEERMDTLFGKDDADAGFAKAASNLR